MKKVALHNLGCKVNAYETEAMQELLEKHGYEIVPFQEGADVYIINTCTVTNMADRKSRQMLHKARKMNPDSIVVACGCYVQAKKDDIPEGIDIVVGNNKKQNIVEILENYEKEKNQDGQRETSDEQEKETETYQEILDINHEKVYEDLHLSTAAEHTRAYIKVQDGCFFPFSQYLRDCGGADSFRFYSGKRKSSGGPFREPDALHRQRHLGETRQIQDAFGEGSNQCQ